MAQSLPEDVWRQIAQAALAEEHLTGPQATWAGKCRLAACLSAVSKSLHSALLGPDAGALWTEVFFSSSHTGLSEQATQALNKHAACQARRARETIVYGGGWEATKLHAALASLAGMTGTLILIGLDYAAEAPYFSAALPACPAWEVSFFGGAPCALPLRARKVKLQAGTKMSLSTPTSPDEMRSFYVSLLDGQRDMLMCLQPLTSLLDLTLHLSHPWTVADVQRLSACHPQLQRLRLVMVASGSRDMAAVAALGQLAVLQLELAVMVFDLSVNLVLQQLRPLSLHTLEVWDASGRLSSQGEAHLSLCRISKQLMLPLPVGRRLTWEPFGTRVVYK